MKMIKGFLSFNFLDGKKWKGAWHTVEMKINWPRIKIDLKEVKFTIITYKCIHFVWIWLYILIIFFFLALGILLFKWLESLAYCTVQQ